MRHIRNILFDSPDAPKAERIAHQVYVAVVLLGFGVANGYLALRLAACSYAPLYHPWVYASYFKHPPIVALNVIPAVLFVALGYFIFRRGWAAYLCSAEDMKHYLADWSEQASYLSTTMQSLLKSIICKEFDNH